MRSSLLDVLSLAVLASTLGAIACSGSNDEALEAVERANNATTLAAPTVPGETERTDLTFQRVYFDSPELITITPNRPVVQLAFRAQGDVRTRLRVTGDDARITLSLYVKTEDRRWEIVASTTGDGVVEIGDQPGKMREYHLALQAPMGRPLTVELLCDGASRDECAPYRQPNDACGSRMRIDNRCEQGLYCEMAQGTCGEADRGGACRRTPPSCGDMQKPVCGCNGVTYDNDCIAAAFGQSVHYEGACRPEDRPEM